MPTLLRRAKPPSPAIQTPPTPSSVVKPTKTLRRASLGKAFKLPPSIVLPDDDRTDYRKVVERYQAKVKNPKSAIRAKCVECSGGSLKEVQMCPVKACALHPFRLGENIFHKKTRDRLARENGDDHDESEAQDESEETTDEVEQ